VKKALNAVKLIVKAFFGTIEKLNVDSGFRCVMMPPDLESDRNIFTHLYGCV